MLDSCTQTGYLSPVELILENQHKVLISETDLEQVKEAADVLCKIIGFKDLEEVMGGQPELAGEIE